MNDPDDYEDTAPPLPNFKKDEAGNIIIERRNTFYSCYTDKDGNEQDISLRY